MMTADDIAKLSTVFATKQDLKEATDGLATRDDLNRVMNKMDAVYGEVVAMRQEQAAHQSQHDRTNDRLDKIESIPVIASELRKLPKS